MKISEIEVGKTYVVKQYNKKTPPAKRRGLSLHGFQSSPGIGFNCYWSYWEACVVGREGRKFVIEWDEPKALHDMKAQISIQNIDTKMCWGVRKRRESVSPSQIVKMVC